ncbi:hypothetical protein BPOR_0181g00040 [Botrytis porri]|uniref:Uncharacterized protein n=1 Tax=Botrytis porri TaxID=87229 RepID=A0A4Z1KUL1_9HELO|nr:hypothetical protein BPOR_0181g00040 [Botrytis porri]
MEEYQSISSKFYRRARHFGNLFGPDDVQFALQKHKFIIENDPALADMSSGGKTYLKEKRAWLEIFKSFVASQSVKDFAENRPFPGIEPKHIVDVAPLYALSSTNEDSESNGSEDAPTCASSAKRKGKEITPKTEP